MSESITRGAIMAFFTSPCSTRNQEPKAVQVLKIVATSLPTGGSRYRLIVSDGEYYLNTLMPSKGVTESLLVPESIVKNSVIRVTEYALKEVNDKKDPSKTTRLVLATGIEVVQKVIDHRIGDPSDVTKNADAQRKRQAANSAALANRPSSGGGASAPVVKKRVRDDNQYDPISSLNPYRNRWTIKARVTNRGDKKTWSNVRGEGSLFSVDLLDAAGTEIRATFWKEAVDLFYDMLAPGAVAMFSGGKLKRANKQYTSIKNEYEITFDRSAKIVPCEEDASIEAVHFDFVKLASIEDLAVQSTLDFVAVIKDFSPVSTLIAKASGRELFKRDVTVADDSGVAVRLTLWGTEAQKDDSTFDNNPVICVKGARVGEFNGKNLSTGFSSTVLYNDNSVPETSKVQQWWSSEGRNAVTKSLSSSGGGGKGGRFEDRKGIKCIVSDNLGYGDKPDWVDGKATIGFIKHDGTYAYPACPEEGNNKKVVEHSDGSWHCEANGKSYDAPEWRYILSMVLNDHTGSHWVTAFNDQAVEIMGGTTAGELKQLQETDERAFETKFSEALFQELVVTLRCKADNYKDETRVRVNLQRASKVNFVAESRSIIEALNTLG